MNEDENIIDDRKKIWVITDRYFNPPVTIFTERDPLGKLNIHLHTMEMAINTVDYAERKIAHNRQECVFNWFKAQDLDCMKIDDCYTYNAISVECVWLED
jgi:hypothetical protein